MSHLPFLALLAAWSAAPVQAQPSPDTLILKTGSPQGSYQVVAGALQRILEGGTPPISLETRFSSGSVENVVALGRGDADLAIVQNDVAFRAVRGQEPFEGRAITDLRAIMGLHPEEILVIGRRGLGVSSVSSIRPGSRVLVGEAGSGTLLNARNVLDALGLEMALVDTLMRSPRANLHLLATGSLDYLFLTAGVSAEFVEEVQANDGAVLTLGDDLVRLLQESHPYYRATTLDLNGRAVRTVQIRAVLLAGGSLPADLAEEITRRLNERLSTIRASHPRAQEILPGTLTETVPVRWHPGADRYYCEIGIRGCANYLPYMLALLSIAALAFLALSFSGTLRRVLQRVAPGVGGALVRPEGVTARYRYILVPVLIVALLFASAFVVQVAEGSYALANGTRSEYEDIGLNRGLLWMVVFNATGLDDGRFPQSPMGRVSTAFMQWIGIGGVLVVVGMALSDHITRRMKMDDSLDPARLEGHVIVCGWNQRAPQLIRSLTTTDVQGRRQTVVIVADLPTDPVDTYYLRKEYVRFLRGAPTEMGTLRAAGLDQADTVIVLADDEADDPDARTVMIVLQVEKHAHELTREGIRDRELHSIAEILNPEKKSVLESVHADLVVCPQEFNEKLLVQAVLNPGTSRFLRQVLTVDEENQIVEVPVRGREDPPLAGKTFDEALVVCREHSLLLVAINRGGAPGAGAPQANEFEASLESGPRPLITNPYRPEEREYRIQVGDSLLFLAESARPLEHIFGESAMWRRAFKG